MNTNNGWKQTGEFPKRMADEIKKVKERRRLEMLNAIKSSADHVKAELAKPRKAPTRVATIQNVHAFVATQPVSFDKSILKPVLTHKRRRWLRKHKGYPVPQTGA